MYVILGLGIREKSDEVSQHRSLSYIFHCSFTVACLTKYCPVTWYGEKRMSPQVHQ